MGGRGSSSASSRLAAVGSTPGPTVMSEDEYLARKGVGDVLSGYMDDKTRLPHGETLRQRQRREKEATVAIAAHAEKRKAARVEYKALVDSGKLRPPTTMEKRLKTAQGDPSNEATQAARRVLERRGIDWRTGERL